MGDLTTFETIIIAIVEGLTEFLPVSSTGHMIITQNILGVESTEFVKAFTVIIQFGAILSVVCLYWKRFFRLNHTPAPAGASALKCFLHKFDFYWKLLVAFIPAAILGFLFSDKIDEMLESVAIVAVMLVIGGIFMLFCDKIFSKGSEDTVLTERKAFNIGLFQCIAMIPGVSRSMATIVCRGGLCHQPILYIPHDWLFLGCFYLEESFCQTVFCLQRGVNVVGYGGIVYVPYRNNYLYLHRHDWFWKLQCVFHYLLAGPVCRPRQEE